MIRPKCQFVTSFRSLVSAITKIASTCMWMLKQWRFVIAHGTIGDSASMVSAFRFKKHCSRLLSFVSRAKLPQQTHQKSVVSELSLWFLSTRFEVQLYAVRPYSRCGTKVTVHAIVLGSSCLYTIINQVLLLIPPLSQAINNSHSRRVLNLVDLWIKLRALRSVV